MMFTDICILDEFGNHVYTGANCPHDREEDEMGEVLPEGWTVQGNG